MNNTNEPKSPGNSKQPPQDSSEKPEEALPGAPPLPSPSESTRSYATESQDTTRISGAREGEYQKKRQEEFTEGKGRTTARNFLGSKKAESFYEYASYDKERAMTYILLILGLIILFFNNLLGGLIIGIVVGYHFASEIIHFIRNLDHMIEGRKHLRYVVLTVLLLAFFIAIPGIFIGAAIAIAFQQAVTWGKRSRSRDDDETHDRSGGA